MCDPITIGKLALTAVSTVSSMSEANKAASRASAQAEAEYRAAAEETKRQYQESNRQIAEAQKDELKEESQVIREANERLGTLRATETALSDASLTTILFEDAYVGALNIAQIDENTQREVASMESQKYAAEQSYISRTVQAKNQANNLIAESQARKTGALLNAAGSGLQIGADQIAMTQRDQLISGAKVQTSGQIVKDWFS